MIYLMNPKTGTVNTVGDWEAEGFTEENSYLFPVEEDENGDWVESE